MSRLERYYWLISRPVVHLVYFEPTWGGDGRKFDMQCFAHVIKLAANDSCNFHYRERSGEDLVDAIRDEVFGFVKYYASDDMYDYQEAAETVVASVYQAKYHIRVDLDWRR